MKGCKTCRHDGNYSSETCRKCHLGSRWEEGDIFLNANIRFQLRNRGYCFGCPCLSGIPPFKFYCIAMRGKDIQLEEGTGWPTRNGCPATESRPEKNYEVK